MFERWRMMRRLNKELQADSVFMERIGKLPYKQFVRLYQDELRRRYWRERYL